MGSPGVPAEPSPLAARLRIDVAQPSERPILVNLLQLYFYDFSEFDDDEAEVDEQGRFPDYPMLERYWSEPGQRFPLLFRLDGRLAGFALVRRLERPGSEPTWGMVEFCVLRRYRRQGLGRLAARALFNHFHGRWEVGQIHGNASAIRFWRRVIGEYTGGRFSEEGAEDPSSPGPVQIFRTPD